MSLVLMSDLDCTAAKAAVAEVLSEGDSLGYLASGHETDQSYYRATQEQYSRLGLRLEHYLDLEQGFSTAGLDRLMNYRAIHLAGGETFGYLAQVHHRGLREEFSAYFGRGGTLIGLSAGAMLMTPTIACAPLCDDLFAPSLDKPIRLFFAVFTPVNSYSSSR